MLSVSARPVLAKGATASALWRVSAGGASSTASRAPFSSASVPRASTRRHPTGLKAASMTAPRVRFSTSANVKQAQQETQEEKTEMDDGERNIHDILTREFQPKQLQVQDVSGGCGSFYAIVIASSHFNGKPTVKAHRLVNEALKDVIATIHGLQLRTMPVKD